ncbi:MAG TPA: DinB family protein [Thermomicrobiaceae bacterium]|nr:DinB family protein [Thermomicrobiaceae bacterium]
MDASRTLRDLYAYNGWANARVFAICRDVDRDRLEAAAPGTFGSIEETLKHLVGVEDVYLFLLRDEPIDRAGDQAEYFARPLDWFAARAAELAAGYAELLARVEPDFFDAPLEVAWIDVPLSRHDGLLQVLQHSAQHRAQVLSALGGHRVAVPDVDYVFYLSANRGGTA